MHETDGRRIRGDESRRAVLERAVDIASVDGLDGLSIGRLASEVSASKSGVAGLFGTKEHLQRAVIDAARAIFTDVVIVPARKEPRGIRRVCALLANWLDYSEGRTFSGGCFFMATAAEYDSRPGPVRDAIVRSFSDRDDYFEAAVRHAVAQGELPSCGDPGQLVFELTAMLEASNSRSLLSGSPEPYARARTAIASRLLAAGADPNVIGTSALARPTGSV
jgi:AcrR family transcriptional regulator